MNARRVWRSRGRKLRNVPAIRRGLEEMEPRVLLSSATFALTSDWGTGFGGQVTITNTQTTRGEQLDAVVYLGPLDHADLGRDDLEPCRQSVRDHKRRMERDDRAGGHG